jgi:hypothetical protein
MAKLVSWRFTFAEGPVQYLGVSIIVLFLAGLARKGVPAGTRRALVGVALLLLLFTGGSYLASRSVHFLVVVLAAGVALAGRSEQPGTRFLLLALLLLDLGPTTVQSPFRPDLAYDRTFMEQASVDCGGGRAIRVSVRDGHYDVSQWATNYDSGQPLATGPFREAATLDYYAGLGPMLDHLAADLNAGGPLSAETVFRLRMAGVRWLLAEDGTRPLILSARGLVWDSEAPAAEIVGGGLAIAVLDVGESSDLGEPAPPLDAAPPHLTDPRRSGVKVTDVARTRSTVEIAFRAERDGLLLVAFAEYPGVVFELDGEPAKTNPGPYGTTEVRVTAGTHRLRLDYSPPGYLVVGWIGSIVLFAVVLALGLLRLLLRRR